MWVLENSTGGVRLFETIEAAREAEAQHAEATGGDPYPTMAPKPSRSKKAPRKVSRRPTVYWDRDALVKWAS